MCFAFVFVPSPLRARALVVGGQCVRVRYASLLSADRLERSSAAHNFRHLARAHWQRALLPLALFFPGGKRQQRRRPTNTHSSMEEVNILLQEYTF